MVLFGVCCSDTVKNATLAFTERAALTFDGVPSSSQ